MTHLLEDGHPPPLGLQIWDSLESSPALYLIAFLVYSGIFFCGPNVQACFQGLLKYANKTSNWCRALLLCLVCYYFAPTLSLHIPLLDYLPGYTFSQYYQPIYFVFCPHPKAPLEVPAMEQSCHSWVHF